MQDDAFHEIQLNGKQLVFLFMAATVVAVVIFLCGVMVGRGVPQRAGDVTEVPIEAASIDPTVLPPAATSSSSSTAAAPLTAGETLTYTERLEEPTPAAETLKAPGETATATSSVPARAAEPVAEKPRPIAAVSTPAAPAPAPAPPPPAPIAAAKPVPPPPAPIAASASKEPAGVGFVVQVAAVKERGEADTIARRLSTKGYPAFVTTAPGGVQMFRVRVGKFPDRREAETIAGRLEKEEQFKPWITR
jgi:DedD protein